MFFISIDRPIGGVNSILTGNQQRVEVFAHLDAASVRSPPHVAEIIRFILHIARPRPLSAATCAAISSFALKNKCREKIDDPIRSQRQTFQFLSPSRPQYLNSGLRLL